MELPPPYEGVQPPPAYDSITVINVEPSPPQQPAQQPVSVAILQPTTETQPPAPAPKPKPKPKTQPPRTNPPKSLIARVREGVKKAPNGQGCGVGLAIIYRSRQCAVFHLAILVIPLFQVIVASVFFNDCSNRNIPMFIVVHGVLWIVGNVIQARICFGDYIEDKARVGSNRPAPALKPGEHPPYHCTRMMMHIVQLVGIGFFIACTVNIYNMVNSVSSDVLSKEYCEPVLFWSGFGVVTFVLAFLGLLVLFGIGLIIAYKK